MTAKKTANLTDIGGQRQTVLESEGVRSDRTGPLWTPVDSKPAVFKTVCGALLRRPGWVRFPSIPAIFAVDDSQHDSHRSGLKETPADCSGHCVPPSRPGAAEARRPSDPSQQRLLGALGQHVSG